MSSSTERKNRQAARAEGTDKKTIAAQKDAAKKRKDKIKWYAVAAVIVIFFAFVLYLNSGAFYRNLTGMTVEYGANKELGIEAGSRSFTVAECNYVYNMQFMNMYNNLGDYAAMMGLDTSKPLDEQPCAMSEDENYTWDDYFTDGTKDYLEELAILEAYAKANDITLDKEDNETIDKTMSTYDNAKEYGYASANKFIAANYGKGTNTTVVRSMIELQQLATKAQQSVADSFEFTSSELKAKYADVKDSWDKFTYSFYLAEAETETGDDGSEAAPTEKALAAAKETAQLIMDKMDSGKLSLAKAAKEIVKDADVTEQTDVAGSEIEEALTKWLTSSKRESGDTTVIDASNGSYVVVFTSRDDNNHKTEESGDMLYCDYIADNLLRNDKLEAWHSEKLGVIKDDATIDTSFGMRYVGR